MSTTGENHPLSPNAFYTRPLGTWAKAIQALYPEAKQYFLEKVEHHKALSIMEHEFLVVHASHPSGSKVVLGVDRNAQDSAQAFGTGTFVFPKSLPLSSTVNGSPHLAYDRVQVSHDGTAAPILTQYGSHVLLYTITFPSPLTASTSSSNSDASPPPSLLHLSVLLLTIRKRFPSYNLLKYQCYFFAHVTCLTLKDLFDGVLPELEEGRRAATWHGCARISVFSGMHGAAENVSNGCVLGAI